MYYMGNPQSRGKLAALGRAGGCRHIVVCMYIYIYIYVHIIERERCV